MVKILRNLFWTKRNVSYIPLQLPIIICVSFLLQLSIINCQLSIAQSTSSCINADFSMGDFTNWQGETGGCCPIVTPNNGIITGRQTIMTGSGTDVNACNGITVVAPGQLFSARLGSEVTGAQAEKLIYTFAIDSTNDLLIYKYAVVLQDPGHTPAAQPRFQLRVLNAGGQLVDPVCGQYLVVSGAGIPGFQHCINGVIWKDWTTVGLDLSPYIGQNITVEFGAGDCALGGHFGYAYINAFCSPLQLVTDYCTGSVSATITAPIGFTYQWSTGETTQSININNPVSGSTYSCTLTSVTGCQVTLSSVLQPVDVRAHFTVTSDCYNDMVFQNTSVTPTGTTLSSAQWTFGDGSSATAIDTMHVFPGPGSYNVTMAVTNSAGCHDTITQQIVASPVPVAGFALPSANVCLGSPSVFTNQSTLSSGTITSYHYDFGDSATSTQPSPTHTYTTTGTYTVKLIITSATGCSDSITRQTIVYPIPLPAFSFTNGCKGAGMNFTDQSTVATGTVTQWSWNFGDGGTSGSQNPAYNYAGAGVNTVTLTVTSDGGCPAITTMQDTVYPLPLVDFGFSNVCFGDSMNFHDLSSVVTGYNIVRWNWDFGDGVTSTLQNPKHKFSTTGIHNITLTVQTNKGCSGTISMPITVNLNPTASFNFTDGCMETNLSFTGTSVANNGTFTNWNWNFGDGNTSSVQNPFHAFTAVGQYNVQLKVTTNFGCVDSIVHPIIVYPLPVPAFTFTNQCKDIPVQFTDGSSIPSGNITQWTWFFGDGGTSNIQNPTHAFTIAGQYIVKLRTTSNFGCSDSVTHIVTIYPKPHAAFSHTDACLNFANTFTDASVVTTGNIVGWNWSFGDANTAAVENPTHLYTAAGSYAVVLIATSDFGCLDTIQYTVVVHDLPIAAFTVNNVCQQTDAVYNNTSSIPSGNITGWNWDFGDATTSVLQNPAAHQYSAAGTYNIQLIVTSSFGCRDTIVEPIVVSPMPLAAFSNDTVCFKNSIQFTDNSTVATGNIAGWLYDFGDSGMSILQNPAHYYASPGNYTVSFTITTDSGCTNNITHQVIVYPLPVDSFSNTTVCYLLTTGFADQSTIAPGYSIVSWNWDFGDGQTSAAQNPTHYYSAAGLYNVQLMLTSDKSCMDTITKQVEVYPLPQVHFSLNPDSGCKPLLVNCYDNSFILNGYHLQLYKWYFGDGDSALYQGPSHLYLNDGTYRVKLIVTSSNGCTDSLAIDSAVTVFPKPIANFSFFPQPATIIYPFINFRDSSYYNVIKLNWNFGDGTSDTLKNPVHEFADTGTYPVELIAENKFGCSDTIILTVVIDPDFTFYAPNAFSPNNDGINDYFYGKGVGIKDYTLNIYDRWGINVFTSKSMDNVWDGRIFGNDEIAQEDVYIYIFKLKDVFGNVHTIRGHVTLIK